MKKFCYTLGVLSVFLLVGACGPIRAVSATGSAEDQLFKAKLAGADKIVKGERYITPAQYQYHLATLYIKKSKELQGFAKYDAAYFYATRAQELSKAAVKNKGEEERRKIRRQQIRSGQVLSKPQGN